METLQTLDILDKLEVLIDEIKNSPIKTIEVLYKWKTYSAIHDIDYNIICILIDWKYNKNFNQDFFNNFSDFELYSHTWELNIKQAEFINNYKSYEK